MRKACAQKRGLMRKRNILFFMAQLCIICVLSGCGGKSQQAMNEQVTKPETTLSGQEEPDENFESDIVDSDNESEDGNKDKNKVQNTEIENNSNGTTGTEPEGEDENSTEIVPEVTDNELSQKKEPVKVRGIYISGPVAGTEKMDDLISLVNETELNAMVIDIKNDDGKITYNMQSDTVTEIGAGTEYVKDINALVSKCKENDIYLIARIVAFKDPYLAEHKPELSVTNKDGSIFRDKKGLAWVNPYKREVWDYLIEIATEAANIGFDEIQFDYIRFSTDLKPKQVDFGEEAENVSKTQIITEFTKYAYEKLSKLNVYVAADVYGTVIDSKIDQDIVGQDYKEMASHLDYICPMVYPSHYANGSYGIPIPDAEPYRTVKAAMSAAARELSDLPEDKRAVNRVWIQDFTASWVNGHIKYGKQQIRDQIRGAYEAGYDEWILWNAAVNYKRDILLTDEEAVKEAEGWAIDDTTQGTMQAASGNESEISETKKSSLVSQEDSTQIQESISQDEEENSQTQETLSTQEESTT